MSTQDAYSNTTAATSNVTVNLSSDSASYSFSSSSVTITAPAFTSPSFTYTDNRTGTHTLTGSDQAAVLKSATATAMVGPSGIDHFVISRTTDVSSQVLDQTAGAQFTATVTAIDGQGNVKTNYSGSLTPSGTLIPGGLSSSTTGCASNHTTVTVGGTFSCNPAYSLSSFSNGVATFSVTAYKAEGPVQLTLNDGSGHTGASNTFSVAHTGVLDHFDFSAFSATAGTLFSVTVTARDPFGNAILNYSGTPTLSGTLHASLRGCDTDNTTVNGGPNPCNPVYGPLSNPFSNGQASANVTPYKAEGPTGIHLTVTDSSASVTSNSAEFTVAPAAATRLKITTDPQSPPKNIVSGAITVESQDPYGNTSNPGSTTTVNLGSDSGGTYAFYLSSAGNGSNPTSTVSIPASGTPRATFYYKDNAVGSHTITVSVTGNALASDSQSVTITQPLPDHFIITTTVQSTHTNVASASIEVELLDVNGNEAEAGSFAPLTLTLTSNTSGTGVFSPTFLSFGAADSRKTFTYTDDTAGDPTLSVSGTIGSTPRSAQQTIHIVGVAMQLSFSAGPPASRTADQAFGVTVQALDAVGHVDDTYTSTINLSIDPATNSTGAALTGTTSPNASAGQIAPNDLAIHKVGTGYKIKATSGSLTPATSATGIDITPGAANKLRFTQSPGGTITGGVAFPTQPIVQVWDTWDNLKTDGGPFQVTLGILSGTGTSGATFSCAALKNPLSTSSGIADFGAQSAACKIDKVGTAATGTAYQLDATSGSLTHDSSAAFDVTAGSATQLAFTNGVTPPQTISAGTISSPITVTAEDAGGNPANPATITSNIQVSLTTSSTGALCSGWTSHFRDSLDQNVTSVAIPSGSNSATFKYCDLKASAPPSSPTASWTLTGSSTGLSPSATGSIIVTPTGATQLAFTPTSITFTAGATPSTTIVVTLEDVNGNPTSALTDTTVNLFTTSNGGTCGTTCKAEFRLTPSGAATPSVVITHGTSTASVYYFDTLAGGPSTFGNGTPTLTGKDDDGFGGDGPLSNAVMTATVQPGTANKLAFTQQPINSTAAPSTLNSSPSGGVKVQIQDQFSNATTVPNGQPTVTVALNTVPSGTTPTLGGTTASTTTGSTGAVTFTTLTINLAGSGYTLKANILSGTWIGLTQATSSPPFTITAGSANKLAFVPATGQTFTASNTCTNDTNTALFDVQLQDANGNATPSVLNPGRHVTLSSTSTGRHFYSADCSTDLGTGSPTVLIATTTTDVMFRYTDMVAGGPTLTAHSSDSPTVTDATQVETVQSSTTTHITVSPTSATITAGGTTGTFTVTRRDGFENPVTTSGIARIVGLATDDVTGIFKDNTNATVTQITILANQATATFTYTDTSALPSPHTLTISSTSTQNSGLVPTVPSITATVTVNPGTATHLAFLHNIKTPQDAGVALVDTTSGPIQVAAEDASNNIVTSFNSNITMSIATDTSGQGLLSGTTTQTAGAGGSPAGVATFSNLSLNRIADYTLGASQTSGCGGGGQPACLPAITSNTFHIQLGSATKLSTVTASFGSGITAGTPTSTLTVTVTDGAGNPVPVSGSNLTIYLSTDSTATQKCTGWTTFFRDTATPTPNNVMQLTIPIGQDHADFTYCDTKASSTYASGSHPNITIADQASGSDINLMDVTLPGTIAAATADHLFFTTGPFTLTAGTASPTMTVQIQDVWGNPVAGSSSGNGTAITLTSNSASFSFSPSSFNIKGPATSGSFTYTDNRTGTHRITVTATGAPFSPSASVFQDEVVNPGALASFSWASITTPQTAGIQFTVQVTALDGQGNTKTDYAGTPTKSSTMGASPSGCGSDNTTVLGTTANGGTFACNPVFTLGSFSSGVATATVKDYKLETTGRTLTLTDGTVTNTSGSFTVSAAGPAQVGFFTSPLTFTASNTCATNSTTGPITVELRDQFGNATASTLVGGRPILVAGPAGSKIWSTNCTDLSGASPANTITIAQGSTTQSFRYTATVAGNSVIALSSSAAPTITGSSQTETIQPISTASSITVSPTSATITAGATTGTFTVTRRDQFGNPITTSGTTRQVNLATDDLTGIFKDASNATVTSINILPNTSSATFTYSDTSALPSPHTLTLSSNSVPSITASVTVNPAMPVKLVFTPASQSMTAGTNSSLITLHLEDTYNNDSPTVGDLLVDLHSTSNGVNATFKNSGGTSIGNPAQITITGGTATKTFFYYDEKASPTGTPWSITGTENPDGSYTDASTSITVTAATADHLLFTTSPYDGVGLDPAALTAGVASGTITVGSFDHFGNAKPSATGRTVVLTTSSTGGTFLAMDTTVLPADATVVGGQDIQIAAGSSTASFLYKDTVSGSPMLVAASTVPTTIASTTQTEAVNAAAPVQLVFSPTSEHITAGDTTGNITVHLQDQFFNDSVNTSGTALQIDLSSTSPLKATINPAVVMISNGSAISSTFTYSSIEAPSQTVTAFDDTDGLGTNGSLTDAMMTVTVDPAAASKLEFKQEPDNTGTGGLPFPVQPWVAIEDTYGNVRTQDTSTPITLTLYDSTGTTEITTAGFACAFNPLSPQLANPGIAKYSGCKIDKAPDTYTLKAEGGGLSKFSDAFTIGVGVAAQLAFTATPDQASYVAGTDLSPATPGSIQAEVRDAGGNVVTTDVSSVTLSITPGTPTTGGGLDTTLTCNEASNIGSESSGVVSWTNCFINRVGTGYKLRASATFGVSTHTDTASSFDITYSTPYQLEFGQQPTNTAAEEHLTPAVTVKVEDQFGNLVANATDGVWVDFGVKPTGAESAVLSGGGSSLSPTAAGGGIATFSTLSVDVVADGYQLRAFAAFSGGVQSPLSSVFNITEPATKLAFISPFPGDTTAHQPIGAFTVEVQNDAGDRIATSIAQITISITSPSGVSFASGTYQMNAEGGQATFDDLVIDPAGTYTLTASATLHNGPTSADYSPLVVSLGSATKIAFSTEPSPTLTAGRHFAQLPVVSLEDAGGNKINDPTAVTLSVNGGTGTGFSCFTDLITLESNPVTTTASGNAQFDCTLTTASTTPYTFHATATVGGSPASADSTGFTVGPDVSSKLVFKSTAQPSDTTAGTPIPSFKVDVVDGFGNQTGDGGSITVVIHGVSAPPIVSGDTATATAGEATFSSATIDKSGTYQLDASGSITINGIPTTLTNGATPSTSFMVSPDTADPEHVHFTSQPTNTTAGQTISSFTAEIRDKFENVVDSGATVSLGIASYSGSYSGALFSGTIVSAVHGVATFDSLVIRVAGDYTLNASSAGPISTDLASDSFTIAAADPYQIKITSSPVTVTAGQLSSPLTATVVDQYGNAQKPTTDIQANLGSIGSLSAGAGCTDAVCSGFFGPTASNAQTDTPIAFVTIHTTETNQSFKFYATLSGTPSITVADNNPTGLFGDSQQQTVNAAASARLTFAVNSLTVTAGVTSGATTIRTRDRFGNLSKNPSGVTVYLTSTSATATFPSASNLTTPPSVTIGINASSTTFTYNDTMAGSYTITAADQASGPDTGLTDASLPVTVNPSGLDHFVYTAQPATNANITAGASINGPTGVTVAAEDSHFNRISGISITMSVGVVPAGGTSTLNGTLTGSTNSSGVITFSNLSINIAGTGYKLLATSGSVTLLSNAFNIVHDAANKLVFRASPSGSTVAGANLSPQPVVDVTDHFGNVITEDGSTSVALTVTGGTAGAALACTSNSLTVTLGEASFANCKVTTVGSGYKIRATPTPALPAASFFDSTNTFSITADTDVTHQRGLAFTPSSDTMMAGGQSTMLSVVLTDQFGNVLPGGTTQTSAYTVTLDVTDSTKASPALCSGGSQDTGARFCNGTTAITTVSIGVGALTATPTFRYKDILAGVHHPTATAPGLLTGTLTITVNPSTASKLTFTTQPGPTSPATTITSGDLFGNQPVVAVQDQYNNTLSFGPNDTTGSGGTPITLAITGVDPLVNAEGFSCTTNPINTFHGVSTFAGCLVLKAGTYTLTASGLSLTQPSSAFTVVHAGATKIVVTGSTTDLAAGDTRIITATIEDAHNNTVTDGTDSMLSVHFAQSAGIGSVTGLSPDVTATGGIATKTVTGDGAGSVSITASSGSLDTTNATISFTVVSGGLDHFVIDSVPDQTAGLQFSVTVTAYDASNNVKADYQGGGALLTHDLSNSDSGCGLDGTASCSPAAAVSFTNGVGTVTITAYRAEDYRHFTVADGLVTKSSNLFNVAAAGVDKLAFLTAPQTISAGNFTGTVTVALQDHFGNQVTVAGARHVALASDSANGQFYDSSGTTPISTVDLTNSGDVLYFDTLAGTHSLTASSTGLTTGSQAVTVNPAGFDHYTLDAITTRTAGVPFQVSIKARDVFGNVQSDYAGTPDVSGTAGSSTMGCGVGGIFQCVPDYPTAITFTNGIATPMVTLYAAETGVSLEVVDGGVTADSNSFDVMPAAWHHFGIDTISTQTAGSSFGINVYAYDAFGNLKTDFAGAPTLSTNLGSSTTGCPGPCAPTMVPSTLSFTGGVASSTITGYRSQSLRQIKVSYSGQNSFSNTFTMLPAALDHFTIASVPTQTAGVAFNVTATAFDAYGNLKTNYIGLPVVTNNLNNSPSGATPTLGAVSTPSAGLRRVSVTAVKAESGRNVTFTDGSVFVTSNNFTVNAATALRLGFTTPPQTFDTGTVSSLITVQNQDGFGNAVTAGSTITGSLGSSSGTGVFKDASNTSIVTGFTISGGTNSTDIRYTDTTVGDPLITASAAGHTNATQTETVMGAASKLLFGVQPSNATAGQSISPTVTVRIVDSANHLITGSSASITVAIGTNAGGGTLSGTATQAASGGTATFGNLSIDKAGTGYTLSASDTGLTGATSAAFNITAGSAFALAIGQQPTTATSSATISPAVTVMTVDHLGNPTATPATSITLAIGTNPPGTGTLSGTLTQGTSGGVATFSNLSIDKAGTGYTLSASATGLTGATSSTFNINAGAASQLLFVQQPTTANAGASISPAITVRAADGAGNTVTSFISPVSMAIDNNAGSGTLSGTTVKSAVAGVATFNNLSINKPGVGYTLRASSTGLTAAVSGAFNINLGPAAKLAFIQQPSNTVAGSVISPAVTVQVQDIAGNQVTSSTAAVTMSIGVVPTGGQSTFSLGTTTVNAVSGLATFSDLVINAAGTGYRLHAASGSLTALNSNLFNVTPGAAVKLGVGPQPVTTTAGQTMTAFGVKVLDSLNNTVTSSTASITIALSTNPTGATLLGTLTKNAVAGVATFNDISIAKAGTGYKIRGTSSGLTQSPQSSSFDILVGPASQLAFVQQPTTTTAGQSISPAVTVKVMDSAGNTVTTSTAAITMAIGTNPSLGTLAGTTTVNAVAGMATFGDLSIAKAGTGYTLQALGSGLSSATSNAFNVNVGAASKLGFAQQPTTTMAGAAITPAVTVQVQDAVGNLVTAAGGSVTVALSSNPTTATLLGTKTMAISSGVATFSDLSITQASSGYNLVATDSGLTGAFSNNFTITNASADHLAFLQQPTTTTATQTISPAVTVQVFDAYGNLVTTSNPSVTLAFGTNAGSGTLSGTTTQSASGGVATFANLSIDKVGTGYTLKASSTGVSPVTSSTFDITLGSAAKLAFIQQPTNATQYAAISPAVTVQVQDAGGNLETGSTASIIMSLGVNPGGTGILNSGATPTACPCTVSASGGVATFNALWIKGAANGYGLTAGSSGLTSANSSTFNIAAGKLVYITPPPASITHSTVSGVIQVQLQDQSGNPLNTVADLTVFVSAVLVSGSGSPGWLCASSSPCSSPGIASVPMSAGTNTVSYYYDAPPSGSKTVVLRAKDQSNNTDQAGTATDASQNVSVT